MIEKIKKEDMTLDKAVTLIMGELQDFKQDVNDRFDKVDSRFDKIEHRLDSLEESMRFVRSELYTINKRLEKLEEGAGYTRGYAKEIDELRARVNALEAIVKSYEAARAK